MNMLRKNRLTKIIILSLLIIFGFQATGLATVMDLRAEGDIAATDVLLAMLSGFAQGIVMKPGWGVYQVFAYTYLVPVASREISDAAGIDNAYARAALQMGLSMGVTTFFDLSSASKEALKETTEKASQVLAEEGVQAAEKVWDDAIKVATDPVAKGVLTQAKDTFMQSVKVVSSKGDSLRNIALAAEQSVFKEFGIVSANRFVASLQKGVQGAFYGAGRQYLYENIKKHSKDLAGFLSTTGSALFAQLVGWVSSKFTGIVFTIKKDASGRGILVAEKKEGGGLNVALKKDWQDFKHEFKILATGQAIETAGEMAGVKEAGVLFSAGITNVMRAKQEKKDTSTMDQLLEGLKLGAISVGLQNVSLKTKSPVHGAYFNLFASEILKTALIRNTNDSQEIGRGAFFIEGLKKSVTSATADTMSMGRATPWINDAKTFDLDWNNPNDVFFMARYYDYISDLNKYGRYGITTAIANQMISSIHYQTVYNARQILDSALNRAGLVKNDPLKQYYVYLSSPSCRQITTQYYQAKGAVENLLREKEELIKVAANKTERVPDRSKFDKAFGDEKKLAQIKNELAEKKTRTEAEQELFLAIEDYMDLKKVVSTKPLGFGYGSKEHIEPMREKLLAKQREDIELNKDEKTVLSWIKALDSAGQGNILLVRDEKLIDFVTMRDYSEAKARKNIELIQEYLPKVSKKAEILADKKATEVAGEPPSTEEFSKHLEKYTKLDYPQAPEEELLTLKVPKTVALSEQETNLPVDPVERWFKVYGDEYGRVKSLKQDELMNEVLKDYFKNNKLTNVDVFRPIVGGPARYEDTWVEKQLPKTETPRVPVDKPNPVNIPQKRNLIPVTFPELGPALPTVEPVSLIVETSGPSPSIGGPIIQKPELQPQPPQQIPLKLSEVSQGDADRMNQYSYEEKTGKKLGENYPAFVAGLVHLEELPENRVGIPEERRQ